MKNKSKIILSWTPPVVVALIIGLGAILKLAGLTQFVEVYSKIGLLLYMNILGIAELLFVALFLWHNSMKIGFLLLTGYFGGAMALELPHGTFFIIPGVILTLVWIAAYLRDASVLISNKNQVNSPTTATIL